MRTLWKSVLWMSFAIVALLGCGGGGGGGNHVDEKVKVTVQWPAQTRGLTLANSVILSLSTGSGEIGSKVVNRTSPWGYSSTAEFDGSGSGTDYTLVITQYLGNNGSGQLLGGQTLTGEGPFTVSNVPINYEMRLTGPATLQRGHNGQMTCVGVTDGGDTFDFPSDLIKWDVSTTTGARVTCSPDGELYAYNNGTAGWVDVKATVKNDGAAPLTQTVRITIL